MPTLAPLLTIADIKAHYGVLSIRSGKADSALSDLAAGAIGEVEKKLGYKIRIDQDTGLLAPIVQKLDGGRPVVELLASVDLESPETVLTVKELGQTLARRTNFTSGTGEYYLEESSFEVYRLAGPGARSLGIWGTGPAGMTIATYGGSNGPIGSLRQGADNTDSYRGCVEITYTPDLNLSLAKTVALGLCRLDLLEGIASSSISTGDQSRSFTLPADIPAERKKILKKLPGPLFIGTGS